MQIILVVVVDVDDLFSFLKIAGLNGTAILTR